MTPDTNIELLLDKIDTCNDATLERLETIIKISQDIRELLQELIKFEKETFGLQNDTWKT